AVAKAPLAINPEVVMEPPFRVMVAPLASTPEFVPYSPLASSGKSSYVLLLLLLVTVMLVRVTVAPFFAYTPELSVPLAS
ncbi:MAG: hypothetical protein H6Q75_1323, partial [Firmicutes bacterium]|nr:hypothetical protein [Bacillota bacterium]